MRPKDKVAIVSGTGIGEAIAHKFARERAVSPLADWANPVYSVPLEGTYIVLPWWDQPLSRQQLDARPRERAA
jgi:hypothetical protein